MTRQGSSVGTSCGQREVQFRGLEERDWPLVKHFLPVIRTEDSTGVVSFSGDQLLGAVVYDNWTANCVQAHHLLLDPLIIRRGWFEIIYGIPFGQMGVGKIYGLVPADNLKALKLNRNMGFHVKAVLEEAYAPGIDYVLMEMKREECRWVSQPLKTSRTTPPESKVSRKGKPPGKPPTQTG